MEKARGLAVERQRFSFPSDEGSHPASGEEWWYFQSHLESGDRRFGFVVCYLKSGLRMSGLADLDLQRHRGFVFGPELGPILASEGRLEVSQGPSRWEADQDGSRYKVHDEAPGDDGSSAIADLVLRPLKPPIPISGGRVKMGRNGSACWYAQTRIHVEGEIHLQDIGHKVEGIGWIDRQWGNWNRMGFGGWKWFSMHLENGTEAVAYLQYEPISHRRVKAFCQIIGPDSAVRLDRGVRVEDLGVWRSPRGANYSSGWRITCPALAFEVEVKPHLQDQEFYSGLWEGSCSVAGKLDGDRIHGVAYTELNLGRPAPILIKHLSYVKAVGSGILHRWSGI